MEGARTYARLFQTGQYGRFYFTSSEHARGKTFRIQILPEGEVAIPNGGHNACLNKDAVEVYGAISGNPGWTEKYGWLHEGKWQEDFLKLVDEKLEETAIEESQLAQIKVEVETKEKEKIEKLLSTYK